MAEGCGPGNCGLNASGRQRAGSGCCDGRTGRTSSDSNISSDGTGHEVPEQICATKRRALKGAGTEAAQVEVSECQGLEGDLRAETLKWLLKAEELYELVSGEDEFLENVSAYIHDCQYFLEKKDLIRAFEAVIWAWAWMEIGLQKGILKKMER